MSAAEQAPASMRDPDHREREYARRFAEEHEHFVEDLGFWRAAADRLGGPVLDVGCATGRVALALARHGHEVWAVDASVAMLDELRARLASEPQPVRRRVRLVHQRMQSLSLGRRFPIVIVAMNTMQLLLSRGDREAAMASLADQVAPGGEVLLDVARLDVGEVREAIGSEVPIAAHRRPDGLLQAQVARYEALEESSQTLEFSIRVREAAPGEPAVSFVRRHRIHMYRHGEIDGLAATAGLRVVEVLGDFAGGAATADADHQIYRLALADVRGARRAAG